MELQRIPQQRRNSFFNRKEDSNGDMPAFPRIISCFRSYIIISLPDFILLRCGTLISSRPCGRISIDRGCPRPTSPPVKSLLPAWRGLGHGKLQRVKLNARVDGDWRSVAGIRAGGERRVGFTSPLKTQMHTIHRDHGRDHFSFLSKDQRPPRPHHVADNCEPTGPGFLEQMLPAASTSQMCTVVTLCHQLSL